MLTVVEYVRQDGSVPYRDWFDSLDKGAAAKISVQILRLQNGIIASVKGLGSIAECRIDRGPGYRVYLGREGDRLILLLGGGTKRRQPADIARAEAVWAEYKARRTAAGTRSDRG